MQQAEHHLKTTNEVSHKLPKAKICPTLFTTAILAASLSNDASAATTLFTEANLDNSIALGAVTTSTSQEYIGRTFNTNDFLSPNINGVTLDLVITVTNNAGFGINFNNINFGGFAVANTANDFINGNIASSTFNFDNLRDFAGNPITTSQTSPGFIEPNHVLDLGESTIIGENQTALNLGISINVTGQEFIDLQNNINNTASNSTFALGLGIGANIDVADIHLVSSQNLPWETLTFDSQLNNGFNIQTSGAAFNVTPIIIPEPSTTVLVGLALTSLLLTRRK